MKWAEAIDAHRSYGHGIFVLMAQEFERSEVFQGNVCRQVKCPRADETESQSSLLAQRIPVLLGYGSSVLEDLVGRGDIDADGNVLIRIKSSDLTKELAEIIKGGRMMAFNLGWTFRQAESNTNRQENDGR